MDNKRKVTWQNTLIGYVEIVGAEMTRLYGRWHPIASRESDKFVEKVANGEDLEVFVESDSGMTIGLVTDISEGQIEFRIS